MNLKNLYVIALHTILSVFDGGVDSAIRALASAEKKLASAKGRLDARIQREIDNQITSYTREQQAISAERTIRDRSRDRASDLQSDLNRAERIHARISELLK